MKTSRSLTAALATVILSASALAYSSKDTTQQIRGPISTLVVSKVVTPSALPTSFTRQVVNIEFSVDPSGQPQDIKVLTKADAAAKEQIVKAFKQWRFESTSHSIEAVSKRFVLPLDIVPEA
jgi:hypothetical protein